MHGWGGKCHQKNAKNIFPYYIQEIARIGWDVTPPVIMSMSQLWSSFTWEHWKTINRPKFGIFCSELFMIDIKFICYDWTDKHLGMPSSMQCNIIECKVLILFTIKERGKFK